MIRYWEEMVEQVVAGATPAEVVAHVRVAEARNTAKPTIATHAIQYGYDMHYDLPYNLPHTPNASPTAKKVILKRSGDRAYDGISHQVTFNPESKDWHHVTDSRTGQAVMSGVGEASFLKHLKKIHPNNPKNPVQPAKQAIARMKNYLFLDRPDHGPSSLYKGHPLDDIVDFPDRWDD